MDSNRDVEIAAVLWISPLIPSSHLSHWSNTNSPMSTIMRLNFLKEGSSSGRSSLGHILGLKSEGKREINELSVLGTSTMGFA